MTGSRLGTLRYNYEPTVSPISRSVDLLPQLTRPVVSRSPKAKLMIFILDIDKMSIITDISLQIITF